MGACIHYGPYTSRSFRNADDKFLFGARRGSVSFYTSIPDSENLILVDSFALALACCRRKGASSAFVDLVTSVVLIITRC